MKGYLPRNKKPIKCGYGDSGFMVWYDGRIFVEKQKNNKEWTLCDSGFMVSHVGNLLEFSPLPLPYSLVARAKNLQI
jgi:hypothetical protein